MFVPLVKMDDASRDRVLSHQSPRDDESRWFGIDGRSNVLLVEGEVPSGPSAPVEGGTVHLLGLDDGIPVWAIDVEPAADLPDGAHFVNLRQLYGAVEERDWGLAGRASQIVSWDRDHRYCGRCGSPTELHESDRARVCGSCSHLSYPRLAPAVIVLVERDDGRALLAWGRQFPGRFFSALAGFVEPGESLEETVVREVKEEVALDVGDVAYFGSQPWPFPHSLMIGFHARHTGGEILPQESEIVEAGWYDHRELPPVPRGGMSIAGWLIEDWVRRRSEAS